MNEIHIASSLSIILLHAVNQCVSTLQVEPTLLLTTKLQCTLFKDGVDADSTLERVILSLDGTCGTQLIDGLCSTCCIVLCQLSLSLDEIHLRKTEDDSIAVGDVVSRETAIVLVVEELLQARI